MNKFKFILLFCIILILSACSHPAAQKQLFAMDTYMNFNVKGKNSQEALNKICDEIFNLDIIFDRNEKSSELNTLNQSKISNVSDELLDIIQQSIDISEQTNGAFDITLAPVLDLWGFYNQNYKVPSDDELKLSLNKIGYKKIYITGNNISLDNTEIDLGGVAKGYAADKTIEILKEYNIESAIISLGGNVYALGNNDGKPWQVGICDPFNTEKNIGIVEVENKAVITSGVYQRNFNYEGKFYHHIIDPKTGLNPNNNISSVTVIGSNSTECDALSTAFMVMGIDESAKFLINRDDLGVIFITNTNDLYVTYNIKNYFITDNTVNFINE